jgi:uncharacterized protein
MMHELPEIVREAWENREGPIVLTTVDEHGVPNAIYASCVREADASHLVVADNYFHKTRANLKAGSPASLLFITGEGKAYQIKGSVTYDTEGQYYQDMKDWNGERPGHAAAVLTVEEVYNGADKLV